MKRDTFGHNSCAQLFAGKPWLKENPVEEEFSHPGYSRTGKAYYTRYLNSESKKNLGFKKVKPRQKGLQPKPELSLASWEEGTSRIMDETFG